MLIPVVLSFVVLAAHFLRTGSYVIVGICLAMPLLLLVRRWWVVRVIQISLLLAAVEWLFTTMQIVQERQAEGRPWLRAGIIFGTVVFWTLASGLVFAHPRIRRRYQPTSP